MHLVHVELFFVWVATDEFVDIVFWLTVYKCLLSQLRENGENTT
jgi:hypothetical protein